MYLILNKLIHPLQLSQKFFVNAKQAQVPAKKIIKVLHGACSVGRLSLAE
jgi:hypothetical protein